MFTTADYNLGNSDPCGRTLPNAPYVMLIQRHGNPVTPFACPCFRLPSCESQGLCVVVITHCDTVLGACNGPGPLAVGMQHG